ncbi:C-GCAxxG-C-C family protein [uncultured Pseudodesulfovibrio sp.]|uniref:C-GCAxxG-C-C family protein n=1 Tax=uncultured Pseudodesulfovibrio sp. TaxID=2035858 RepID=UPI0029C9905A|nr:C-GCAxxG-C-C family protein [uncultured Pseudodesulfovibrio sp.]
MNTREHAVTVLMGGASCAQAVFEAYCERYGISQQDARKMTAGFGGGFASGLTCGAVSAGCLILGLEFASVDLSDAYARDRTYSSTQELLARFAERNGSHQCAEILARNAMEIQSPEGKQRLRESRLCVKMVEDAVDCIEGILAENSAE